jgi:hypothetical protein
MVGKYQGTLAIYHSTFVYLIILVGCANIKGMYLAKCRYVDDWFLSRLAYEYQDQLLFLDLSECRSVGITGILALCRLKYVLDFLCIFKIRFVCSVRSLKKLRLYNLPSFDGKEAATMIFEENVPGCLVEGIDYETEVVAGLLAAGDTQQQDELQMIDTGNNDQQHDNTRQSIQRN